MCLIQKPMNVNSMSLNRERGSVSVPSKETRQTGTYTHCNNVIHTVDYASHQAFRYTADQTAKYGIGVWPYRPFWSLNYELSTDVGRPQCKVVSVKPGNTVLPGSSTTIEQHFPELLEIIGLHPDAVVLPQRAQARILGGIEGSLPSIVSGAPDLFVFLSELRDIKDTFKFLKERALATKVAAGHLSWNFGVKPFLSEISALMDSLRGWRQRLGGLREGVGKVHDTVVRVVWDDVVEFENSVEGCPYSYQAQCPGCPKALNYIDRHVSKVTHTLKCMIKYRYSWPRLLDEVNNEFHAFLAANRFIPSVKSLWEMVPFSFVVDWVINTDQFFERFGLDAIPFDVKTSIVDVCLMYVADFRAYEDWTWNCARQKIRRRADGVVKYRWVGANAMDKLDWDVKLPTSSQLLLGASLVEVLRH